MTSSESFGVSRLSFMCKERKDSNMFGGLPSLGGNIASVSVLSAQS